MAATKSLTSGLIAGTLALGTLGIIVEKATAVTFSYEWNEPDEANKSYFTNQRCDTNHQCYSDQTQPLGLNNEIGSHQSIQTTYDALTGELTWSAKFDKKDNKLPNGGWLVLSDGPNPKDKNYEYAIFYLDGITKNLTAYAYNGQNNSSSWNSNPFLQSWENGVNVVNNDTERTLSFSINTNNINSRTDLGDDWKGVQYSNNLGIWFHEVKFKRNRDDLIAKYDQEGKLTQFNYQKSGWFDSGILYTSMQEVPEPGTMGAIGISLLGLLGFSKKKKQ